MAEEPSTKVDDFLYLYQHYSNQSTDDLLYYVQLLVIDQKFAPKPLEGVSILFVDRGPFSDDEFAELCRNSGIVKSWNQCLFNSDEVADVVVGGGEASWNQITTAIKTSLDAGVDVRFYTQELFILEFIHGFDVFGDVELLKSAFNLDKHLALIYGESGESYEIYFDWKTFKISGRDGSGSGVFLPSQSPLNALGYSAAVSKKIPAFQRQNLLKKCLESKLNLLPQCESEHYMKGWGDGNTCRRLIRIARQVAYCPPNTSSATEQRKQSDLDYLKENYYSKICGSNPNWPSLSKFL